MTGKVKRWGKRLEYTIKGKNGTFHVTQGENRIIKHELWYNTDAVLCNNPWWGIGKFDSFIKAVRFLKENLNNIM